MKKILVPTDFSENAYNALNYGVNLFSKEECEFYILHTYTPSLYNAKYMVNSNLSLDEIYRVNVNKSLTQVIKRIKTEFPNLKHNFKKIACFNTLQDEIKNQVKLKKIELIIMGAQGATGTVQILFGTHTIHTIKNADCPVLVIPTHAEFYPPKNLLVATDFEPDVTEDHLQIIKAIAENHNSKIHILHIILKTSLTSEQEKNKVSLSHYFKGLNHEIFVVKSDSVTEGIVNFQNKKYLDVLVMVRHKRSFFENLFFSPIVEKIGFHLSIPFLVIPVLKNK